VSIQRLQSHWGFTRMPFGRDLAPAMLHRHAGHGEAVARISRCVDQRAIGVMTGEVGAGKTVAVRAATAALDPSRHVIIYLANPTIGVRGMLTHIVAALGHTPAFHKSTLAPKPPRRWPANTPNAAATRSSSSTRPTCSITSNSRRSGC
jgi:type II secretory pathway predicted ATPase ExeA